MIGLLVGAVKWVSTQPSPKVAPAAMDAVHRPNGSGCGQLLAALKIWSVLPG